VLDFGGAGTEFQSLARALSSQSKHPFSRAIADYFSDALRFEVSDWKEERGSGVSAIYSGETVRLGSLKWLSGCGIPLDAVPPDTDGTVLGLARGKKLIGIAMLVDSPKPHAKEVVAQIIRDGFQVHLVSGDSARTVQSVGNAVGIPAGNIHPEIAPGAKAGIVKDLQQQGGRVAFVGDGINDAPALAQADLGIAVMQASDVASEAADILLLKSDIEAIPEALGLSAATLRTIRQNLFWAFFYNTIAIPLAAAGWMSPVFCAAAMALSDLFVIGNALRLLRWKMQ
jgi:Cu+-exporting ATPase